MAIETGNRARVAPRIADLSRDDADALLDVDRWAFPDPHAGEDPDAIAAALDCLEWDRTRGAYVPDLDGVEQLAGINSTYSFDLPVPGGSVACGGLTWVGVHPGYRRRGILTAMISDHLRSVHERAEPVSALWASEASIYGRYGYGIACQMLSGDLPRGAKLRDVPGADEVRIRLEKADTERHADLVGDCYEAARASRPGMVSMNTPAQRRKALSDPVTYRKGAESLRILIAEADDDGPARGYALFARTDGWDSNKPTGAVRVRELIARDPAAARALWARVLDLDLTVKVELHERPIDDPLYQLLIDSRAAQRRVSDSLWVRLVDVPVALAARRYVADVDVVFEVRDEVRPQNAGRWRLTAGLDAARCTPSTQNPAFALDVRELGSAYLGSVSLSTLAGAGLIAVTDQAGFDSAARAFGWPVAASCPRGF